MAAFEKIDIAKDDLVFLTDVAAQLKTTYKTVLSWATNGIHGVKLATVKLGGRRKTTWAAVKHFQEQTGDDDSPPVIKVPVEADRDLAGRLLRDHGLQSRN